MSFLMDLHNTHPMAQPHHHHVLHPDRYHSCQTSGIQMQMVNHSGFYHHTTNCTMPSYAGSGTPCPDKNHRDIHCRSCHGMASNMPMTTHSVPPCPSHPGS